MSQTENRPTKENRSQTKALPNPKPAPNHVPAPTALEQVHLEATTLDLRQTRRCRTLKNFLQIVEVVAPATESATSIQGKGF